MHKLLSTLAISVALAGACVAQEANWDRWFVGFDAGYIGRETWNSAEGQFNYNGFSAGISAGKWWQMDAIALGFDFGAHIGGATNRYPFNDGAWNGSLDYDERLAASARLKAGIPVGNFMPYVAVGPQYIHSTSRIHGTVFGDPLDTTDWETSFGMVAAAGAEYLVTQNLALKGEAGINLAFPNFSGQNDHVGWSVRLGANYYFD